METRIEELLDDRRVAVLMGASRRMLQVWRQQGRGAAGSVAKLLFREFYHL